MPYNQDRRAQIEAIVEDDLGAHYALSDAAHEIYQAIASPAPFVVVRTSEERRVINNFALIGRALKREVYHWSLTSDLYRCKPEADNIEQHIPEPVALSEEAQRRVPGIGLHVISYYLREEWQHPWTGSRPEQNSTFRENRQDVSESEMKGSVFILKDAHMLLWSQQHDGTAHVQGSARVHRLGSVQQDAL